VYNIVKLDPFSLLRCSSSSSSSSSGGLRVLPKSSTLSRSFDSAFFIGLFTINE